MITFGYKKMVLKWYFISGNNLILVLYKTVSYTEKKMGKQRYKNKHCIFAILEYVY